LKNKEILAINQDSVEGTSISPFRWGLNVGLCPIEVTKIKASLFQPDWTSNATHPAQYWSGPSENGTVFMLVLFHTLQMMKQKLMEWIR
jgi:alpha-galactosidase